MPQISVIVPVYKVEKYIHRCIDSILGQSFEDFELILVDDGSPDNCGAICDEYGAKDSRVVVIHQENGGLSAARNAGIDWSFAHSNSQWLTFIDSDDWVHQDLLSHLISIADSTGSDISRCYLTEQEYTPELAALDTENITVQNPIQAYIDQRNTMSACAKLYKKTLFSELRYPIGKLHEDAFLTYKVFMLAYKVAAIDKIMYFCGSNMDSITRSPWNPKRLDELDAYDEQLSYFRKHQYSDALHEITNRYLYVIRRQYLELDKTNLTNHKKKKFNKILSKRMCRLFIKYHEYLDVRFSDSKYLYEIAFPKTMYIYWTFQGIKGKIKRTLIQIYEILYEHYRILSLHRKYGLRIMNSDRTIRYILKHNCSIARFGEGEFGHMLGKGFTYFQPNSDLLSQKLTETLSNPNKKLLLCVPICMNSYRGLNKTAKAWWIQWGKSGRQEPIAELIDRTIGKKYIFGDAMLTRPYMDWKSRRRADRLFRKLKMLWANRDILIVEGTQTRLGIGNDLFADAKSIKRILAPAVGAFDCYDQILESVRKHYSGELILLALGPTATILAADLAKLGYQALDIGHIDVEYEWFLNHATEKTAIQGKFVNEVIEGREVSGCEDNDYLSQIIHEVTSCP